MESGSIVTDEKGEEQKERERSWKTQVVDCKWEMKFLWAFT